MNLPSPGQVSFIRSAIKNNLRIDGRGLFDIREFFVSLGDLKQANGSSVILIPDTTIKIYCGIKVKQNKTKQKTGIKVHF
jgi:exosome complex RNA-binding protein Rrp42 (RNase PH superfamily)